MKLLIIVGPQAVGKMTVGHEIEKITNLKLFHNHMTIELVAPLFGYGSSCPTGTKLVNEFRMRIFEEYAKSNEEGLIFTMVMAFCKQEDWDYIEKIRKIFEKENGEVYLIELEADIEKRLERNRHPHRLNHKPSKKNIEWSEKDLKKYIEKYKLNTQKGEITDKNYIKINNTNISAEETAKIIKEKFNL